MQIIALLQERFRKRGLPLYLRSYEIIVTSSNTGIIEYIPNTVSVDRLKYTWHDTSLLEIFRREFEGNFERAQTNFINSLAGYSLLCYLLAVKDRHNGNILIDSEGHIIHIDYGFILSASPGNMNFEKSPFKLTSDYRELMGERISEFRKLLLEGLRAAREHVASRDYLVR